MLHKLGEKVERVVLGPKSEDTIPHNPKTKAPHLVLPVTHTTLRCMCAAGVASKKIHSGAHFTNELQVFKIVRIVTFFVCMEKN